MAEAKKPEFDGRGMNKASKARMAPNASDPHAPPIIDFPVFKAKQVAMAGSHNWQTFEDDIKQRNLRQTRYWLLAVIVHLAVAALFLIELSRPEDKHVDEAAIEMIAPPAPPIVEPPPPPKPDEAKVLPKPHPMVQRAIPKPVPKLQPPTPQAIAAAPIPPMPRETPPPTPPPSQAAPPADFVGRLYAHLDANKRYPARPADGPYRRYRHATLLNEPSGPRSVL